MELVLAFVFHVAPLNFLHYCKLFHSFVDLEPMERPVYPHKCGKCERTYKHKCGLYKHEKFECGVGPDFPCTLCDFRTAHKGTLRTHLVHVHQVAPSDLDHFQAAGNNLFRL